MHIFVHIYMIIHIWIGHSFETSKLMKHSWKVHIDYWDDRRLILSSAQKQQHEQIRTDAYFVISTCHTYWPKCFTYLRSFAAYIAKRVRCYLLYPFHRWRHASQRTQATCHVTQLGSAKGSIRSGPSGCQVCSQRVNLAGEATLLVFSNGDNFV